MQLGFLTRTPRGRKVTPLGYKHLGIDLPAEDGEQNTFKNY
jgi:Holliday junction DNA helicase RuvB